ncbi:MAG TPA: hypothetical protein DDX29_12035 [Clostridiales bacterium]|nr:hypothetical protein [Clostridiales bacterium]
MPYTDTWDASFEALPTDSNYVYEVDNYIRQLKLAVRERMEKDHYFDEAGTDADHGEHSKITFHAQSAKPTAVANKGFLYTKDVSEKVELFFEDEDANEVQITNEGNLNMSAGTLEAIIGTIYPVGAIYVSTLDTNPATLFGFGTWEAFGAGKTLVGLDSTDTDFDTSEKTGGEKTHELTEAELAPHVHDGLPVHSSSTNVGTDTTGYWRVDSNVTTGETGSAGSGTAHNNLQPYIVVYMFKRTA